MPWCLIATVMRIWSSFLEVISRKIDFLLQSPYQMVWITLPFLRSGITFMSELLLLYWALVEELYYS